VLIPEGRYHARIKDYGVVKSQAGQQHLTVFIEFSLLGQYDPATGQLASRPAIERTYYKAVTDKTIDWLLGDLKAIGYDKTGLEYLDPETPGAANLFDVEIDVDCAHELYEGQQRERWSIHREITREKVGRHDLAKLDAHFSEKFKRVLGSGKPTVAPPVTGTNTGEAY
jgi:hypothetical protein